MLFEMFYLFTNLSGKRGLVERNVDFSNLSETMRVNTHTKQIYFDYNV